jgi:putative PIN family toxin of toxin-antitoxin system
MISALLFSGKSRIVYDYCIEHCDLFISPFLVSEFKEKLAIKFKLNDEIVKRIIKSLDITFENIIPDTSLPVASRDPDDNYVLQLCESISADYLITGDKDLLVLKYFVETTILSPAEFLNHVIKS